jgi:DNA-binding response OmpR family regulator
MKQTMQTSIKKILVADDDPDIAEGLKLMLESNGYAVTELGDSGYDEFFRTHTEIPYDLIILDVFLTDTDGRLITRHLKSRKETKHIPVIMISAQADTGKSAKAAGADEFLAKPFNVNELFELVRKYLYVE